MVLWLFFLCGEVFTNSTPQVNLFRARADRRRLKANAKYAEFFHVGAKVLGKYSGDGVWYAAVIDSEEDGTYSVTYTEFGCAALRRILA